MDLKILPLSESYDPDDLMFVFEVVEKSQRIEQLFCNWITPERELLFARNDELMDHSVGISFHEEHQTAMGKMATADLLRLYPHITLFNDESLGAPEDEWFDARNDRLNIRFEEVDELFIAPPTALAELVLSYALAPRGFARVSSTPHSTFGLLLSLELIFFDGPDSPAWGEHFYTPWIQLESYSEIF